MKKILPLLITVICLSGILYAQPHSSRLYLTQNWSYAAGEKNLGMSSFEQKPDENDFIQTSFSSFDNLITLLQPNESVIWLKTTFTVPEDFPDEDIACYLGQIAMNDQCWINGVHIGKTGFFEKDGWNFFDTPRLYSIPPLLINHASENILYIRIYCDNEGSFTTIPFIATQNIAHKEFLKTYFIHIIINIIIAAILLFMALYHFVLFILRKKEVENLFYALTCLLSALYPSRYFLTSIPGLDHPSFSYLLFSKIITHSLMFLIILFATEFLNQLLQRKHRRIVFFIEIALISIPLVMIMSAPSLKDIIQRQEYTSLFFIPLIAYFLYIPFSALIKKESCAIPLFIGIMPLLVSVIIELTLKDWPLLKEIPCISCWGWQLTVIAFRLVLTSHATKIRTTSEKLTIYLDKKIVEKNGEIENGKKEHAQTQILLDKAQRSAIKNLEVAALVQKSFLQQSLPPLSEWDIAFAYKPLKKISGDMYNFFLDKNKLLGISLFDISGHSFISGLVSMLTQNIVKPEFTKNDHLPLHNMLTRIDKQLIEKKGLLENYVTGIILRIKGKRIEYVNAGHPDILYKNASTKKVQEVTLNGSSIKGRVLGIKGLEESFDSVGFSVKENDSILLYTDGILNAKNKEGSEFGKERLIKAFENADSQFANGKLDFIQKAFIEFCDSENIEDDITLIILQRKKDEPIETEL